MEFAGHCYRQWWNRLFLTDMNHTFKLHTIVWNHFPENHTETRFFLWTSKYWNTNMKHQICWIVWWSFLLNRAGEFIGRSVCTRLCWGCIINYDVCIQLSTMTRWRALHQVDFFSQGGERAISQIPQCTSHLSHNTPFCNENMNLCAHFCHKTIHLVIIVWYIEEFVRLVNWDGCHSDASPKGPLVTWWNHGNIFRDTGPLSGKFTGHRWIIRTKASDAELRCFLWSEPE